MENPTEWLEHNPLEMVEKIGFMMIHDKLSLNSLAIVGKLFCLEIEVSGLSF